MEKSLCPVSPEKTSRTHVSGCKRPGKNVRRKIALLRVVDGRGNAPSTTCPWSARMCQWEKGWVFKNAQGQYAPSHASSAVAEERREGTDLRRKLWTVLCVFVVGVATLSRVAG